MSERICESKKSLATFKKLSRQKGIRVVSGCGRWRRLVVGVAAAARVNREAAITKLLDLNNLVWNRWIIAAD